jgi:transcriptional regulator with XRE-family HTH domain
MITKNTTGEVVIDTLTAKLGISELMLAGMLGITRLTLDNFRQGSAALSGKRLERLYYTVKKAVNYGIPTDYLLSLVVKLKDESDENSSSLLYYILDDNADTNEFETLLDDTISKYLEKKIDNADFIPSQIATFIEEMTDVEVTLAKDIYNPDSFTAGSVLLMKAAFKKGMESMYYAIKNGTVKID